ncbi:CRP/FNR family cyclic AMP-dependent transcriptional regulator [Hydrogenophaga palleronii]|uniref:CRP/FNR family cyclic AMP-dependent transcriptional regulator n=1 Tax=Hydrogenophaga palleronii TaxID=65655 RepID=A0ABU1WHW1_9BURK|nr:Crp/Fnr family transcriptional regulator [Hydrogenophaga palleronii]MDR7148651.1 CRP/FNR family cyclic AMP-dependent transcriptional regulator [Hydrogenophaga palleronii]
MNAALPTFQAPQSTHHIQALARLGVQRRYRRGALLIQEGETGDTLYIVQQGRLRAFLADGNGKELTLGSYGPMEYVGEMSLDGGPRSANVEASENCTCSVVSREVLLSYIASEPEFALELMARLIRRARLATESARSVALIDVYGRLVRLLNQMAREPNEAGERALRERMTHQAMAQHLACSREMVSRLLRDLETGGYVAVRERWIWLLKPLPARW